MNSACAGQQQHTQHIDQTWPQVIFTCSQHWRDFLGADASREMKKCRMLSRNG